MSTYRVKDLMINVVPAKGRGGGTAYPAPDSDTSEFPTPVTPVIAVARDAYKLRFLEDYKGNVDQLNPQLIDEVAVHMGRVAVGAMLTALCGQDQPTCDGRAISPVAMAPGRLQLDDLVFVKGLLNEAVARIEGIEAVAAQRAKADARELVPQFEAALDELRGHGKD